MGVGIRLTEKQLQRICAVFLIIFFLVILIGCTSQESYEHKLSQSILSGNISAWAENGDGTANFTVTFVDGVSFTEARHTVESLGGIYLNKFEEYNVNESSWGNVLIVIIDEDKVQNLAKDKSVVWIDEVPPEPTTYSSDNSDKAIFNYVITPKEVWRNKQNLVGNKIYIRGVVDIHMKVCTGNYCRDQKPCCQDCVSGLGFKINEENYLVFYDEDYNNKSVGCSGNNCNLNCYPFIPGKEYTVFVKLFQIENRFLLELLSVENYETE